MHLLAIGDIGPVDEMIHIGDEAMFDEAIRQLRARGVERVTAISSNPDDSRRRYGVEAVEPLGFGMTDEAARETALGRAIAEADAVLVTGGGNLSSLWRTHIVERARLARIAAGRGIPFVVTGQTLGPVLDALDLEEVGRMLRTARLVGTRERPSSDLAHALGVPGDRLQQTIDDASFLAQDDEGAGCAGDASDGARRTAVITLARHVGDADPDAAADALAALLDDVAGVTGLEPVFLAHFASMRADDAVPRGDSAMHDRVISRMRTTGIRIEPTTDAPAAARTARSASLVITSRYHPAVFAASAAVPTIGIPVDGYTDVKLRGALGPIAEDGILPMSGLLAGGGRRTVAAVWGARDELRARAESRLEEARPASAAWWDRVRDALEG